MIKRNDGFSIVELIIVIAVIGVLAAILVPILSNVIKDSQDASALSDARNTLTDMNVEQMTGSNAIIAVEKGERVYVYGWFAEQKELIEGRFNPYKNMDNKPLRDFLKENDCFLSGSEPQDITGNLGSPLSSITVYGNTSLTAIAESILLSQTNVGMAVGETFELQYSVKPLYATPILPVTFESSDDSIVSVSDGTLTAIAKGTATVTVKFGTAVQTCKVTVTDWQQLDHISLARVKALIEDESNDVTLIKFPNFVVTSETNMPYLFPIVVPKGKVVRIDINDSVYSYIVTEVDKPNSFIINDGGYLSIESNSVYGAGNIEFVHETVGEGPVFDDVPLILNINGGSTSIDSVGLWSDPYNIFLQNIGSNGWINGTTTGLIINEPGSTLVVRQKGPYPTRLFLENYGIVHEISGELIAGYIQNYGVIETIVDADITVPLHSVDGFEVQGDIFNIGKNAVIENIVNSSFQSNPALDAPEWLLEGGPGRFASIVCEDGARIEKITSGKFIGRDESLFFKNSPSKGFIYGGYYSHEVPKEYIADGYECVPRTEGSADYNYYKFEVVPKTSD